MTCIEHFTHTLRQRGYRMTSQRLAILQALHAGGHLAPAAIYARVRSTGMTEATVYRTLEFLAGNGVVQTTIRGNGHLAYELAGGAHHHLVCRRCGAQLEIGAGPVEALIDRLEAQSRYRLTAGHLTFSGVCPGCQEAD